MNDDQTHPLKVTSPRLEQDVFEFTPSGRPDRPDARRLNQRKNSTRATVADNPTDDGTEQATLDGGELA